MDGPLVGARLVYCGPLALLTSLAPVWRMQAGETRRALLPYVGAAAAAASLALRRARGCRGAAGSLGAAGYLVCPSPSSHDNYLQFAMH